MMPKIPISKNDDLYVPPTIPLGPASHCAGSGHRDAIVVSAVIASLVY